jgi:hypothetical protein
MSDFKLENVPGVIKPRTVLLQAVTVATGTNAVPKKVTEVELLLELDVSACAKAVEHLFPGADMYMKTVAGLEHAKGEDRVARTKLPEMNVRVWYGTDTEPVFDLMGCPIKARPQLKVDENGNGRLVLKPRGKFSNKQLADMAQLISADVRVTMDPAQMDMAELTMEEPEKKRGRGRPKKAELRVVDDGSDLDGESDSMTG